MVPPAPGTFSTCTFGTIFSACSVCCMARAVWSQPPPGAAGAMILSSFTWASAAPGASAPAASVMASSGARNECNMSSPPDGCDPSIDSMHIGRIPDGEAG